MLAPLTSTLASIRSGLRRVLRPATALVARLRAAYAWSDFVPLLLPVLVAPWLCEAGRIYAGAAMARDVNMFSYAGWCLRKGERLYQTFAVPDGPFVVAWHALTTLVAGTGDHGLRTLDIVFHGLVAAVIGVLVVPRAWGRKLLGRAVWVLVAFALWMTHLAQTTYGSSMQREQDYIAFGCIAMCLAYASWQFGRRSARLMLVAAGVLSGLLVFGKQSGVVYVALVALIAAALPSDPAQRLRWRLGWVAAGVGLAAVAMLGLVAVAGSLRGFYEWYVRFAIVVYRFFEPAPYAGIFVKADRAGFVQLAGVVLMGGAGAVALRALPPRTLPFIVAPLLHFGLAIAQRKGWEHHYLPVRAAAYVFFLVALVAAWTGPEASRRQPLRALIAVALLVFVGERCMDGADGSAWLRESERHLNDTEVKEAHDAAGFLRDHTRPDDRVLYYGDDPLVLFAAERRPAIPTETVLMLNFSAALNNTSELGPGPEDRYRMTVLQRLVRDDACSRIVQGKPAAMVFTDHAPAGSADGVADVVAACPELQSMLDADYHLETTIKRLRIFLRNAP
ncbi:MAG: hypothetical protein ACRELB_02170 [Polyangiaceae bacterium]